MSNSVQTQSRGIPRLRFNLRWLLLSFVAMGIVLVVFAIPYERQRRQRLALSHMSDLVVAQWADGQVTKLTFHPGTVGSDPSLDERLAHLRDLPHVRELSLELSRVSNDALRHLNYLPQLEVLTFGGTFHLCDSLDVADYLSGEWQGLDVTTPAGLTSVKVDAWNHLLILRNCDINDDGMELLQSVRSLRVLSLHNTGVSDEGIKKLSVLPNLEELDLRLTLVTDQGIACLQEFPSLKKLDLGNNRRITGKCLRDVAKLTQLTALRPPFVMTDETVVELYAMQNLRVLDLTERQVSDEAVQTLKLKLPECKIKL